MFSKFSSRADIFDVFKPGWYFRRFQVGLTFSTFSSQADIFDIFQLSSSTVLMLRFDTAFLRGKFSSDSSSGIFLAIFSSPRRSLIEATTSVGLDPEPRFDDDDGGGGGVSGWLFEPLFFALLTRFWRDDFRLPVGVPDALERSDADVVVVVAADDVADVPLEFDRPTGCND